MLLHRQTCSWCMPPSAAVFVSSPPAPCFSWHFVLDLLCCPCTSHTNTQLWSHKPSLEHRKINGSLLQEVCCCCVHAPGRQKAIFSSLIRCTSFFQLLVGSLWLACSIFSFFTFPGANPPVFRSNLDLFYGHWLTPMHSFHKPGDFLVFHIANLLRPILFFFLNFFSFYICGKGIIPSLILS